MIVARFIAVVIAGYLLGSIPFGLLMGKLKGGIDVRKYGSGKTGAANVMRAVGTRIGVLTLLLDGVKAAGAVLLAKVIVDSGILTIGGVSFQYLHIAQVMAGLAAVAGHNWPVFAGFKGGRGVAAYFGTLFIISPPVAIFGTEVIAISALRSRQMSKGSILGAIAAWCLLVPLTISYGSPPIYLAYGLAAIAFLVYQHRDNVKRLQLGTERQLW